MKATVDKDVSKSLHQVKRAGERGSGLTRQLLAFRKQVLQRIAVDVGHTVRNMEKMFNRLVGETITFEIQCTENVPFVLADESSVEQVILNLVVNARDAMPQGGLANHEMSRSPSKPAVVVPCCAHSLSHTSFRVLDQT